MRTLFGRRLVSGVTSACQERLCGRCFCNDEVARIISDDGFVLELFTKHFPRDGSASKREQGVKDSRVIALSHRLKMVVFTTDHTMREAHKEEFARYPEAMVVATAHRSGTDEMWANAFVKAKANIERLHKKQGRPWFAKITQDGKISSHKTLPCN